MISLTTSGLIGLQTIHIPNMEVYNQWLEQGIKKIDKRDRFSLMYGGVDVKINHALPEYYIGFVYSDRYELYNVDTKKVVQLPLVSDIGPLVPR